jgi:hypothetical protein
MGHIGQRIGGRGRACQGGEEAHGLIGWLCHANKVRPGGGSTQAPDHQPLVLAPNFTRWQKTLLRDRDHAVRPHGESEMQFPANRSSRIAPSNLPHFAMFPSPLAIKLRNPSM